MPTERSSPRDWHRVYGLLWIDFFKSSSFLVEVERDMSQQQQYLDAVYRNWWSMLKESTGNVRT